MSELYRKVQDIGGLQTKKKRSKTELTRPSYEQNTNFGVNNDIDSILKLHMLAVFAPFLGV